MHPRALPPPLMTQKEIAMSVASRLRALRKSLKLSRKELAARSGVSVPSIARFELSGVTTLAVLIKLALVLGAVGTFDSLFAAPKYSSMREFLAHAE